MTLVAVYAMAGTCQNVDCGLPPEQHNVDGRCMTLMEEHYFVGTKMPVFVEQFEWQKATVAT